MDTPILIGLHGVKRSGKNTTAGFIAEWAGAQSPALSALERGFADKAKWAFARQFFPTITMVQAIKWVDTFKDSRAGISYPTSIGPKPGEVNYMSVLFRQALAQFATEGGRDIYGDDFWVDQLLPFNPPDWKKPNVNQLWTNEFLVPLQPGADQLGKPADYCLITDQRFENEVHRIHALGGFSVKIRRKDAEDAVIEQARQQGREIHRSELGLPDDMFDYVINNDDNDLVKARERAMQMLKVLERRGIGV